MANGSPTSKLVLNRLGLSHVKVTRKPAPAMRADQTPGALRVRRPAASRRKGSSSSRTPCARSRRDVDFRLDIRGPMIDEDSRAFAAQLADAAGWRCARRDSAQESRDRTCRQLLAEFDVLLCPSMWFENGPTIALEADRRRHADHRQPRRQPRRDRRGRGQRTARHSRQRRTNGRPRSPARRPIRRDDRSVARRPAEAANDGRDRARLSGALRQRAVVARGIGMSDSPRDVLRRYWNDRYATYSLDESSCMGAGERFNRLLYRVKNEPSKKLFAAPVSSRRARSACLMRAADPRPSPVSTTASSRWQRIRASTSRAAPSSARRRSSRATSSTPMTLSRGVTRRDRDSTSSSGRAPAAPCR